jgi:adenylate cyclase
MPRHWAVLFIFIHFFVFEPRAQESNSGLSYIEKIRSEAEKARQDKDTSKALGLAEKAVNMALQSNNKSEVLVSELFKAELLVWSNAFERGLSLYDSVGKAATKSGLFDLSYKANDAAGVALYQRSRYAESLERFLANIEQSKKAENKDKLAESYNNVGVVYEAMKDNENALQYHRLSLDLRSELDDSSGLAQSNNNLGMVSFYMKNYLASYGYHKESLRLRKLMGNERGEMYSIFNLSNIFFAVSKLPPDSAFSIFGSLPGASSSNVQSLVRDSALHLRQSALADAIRLDDPFAAVWCRKGIGEIRVEEGRWTDAIVFLEEAAKGAESLGMKKELSDIYELLSKAYEGNGNIPEALKNHKLFFQVRDSVFGLESSRKISDLQKKQQRAEMELVIERQKLIRNYTFAVLALVLGFSIVLMRQRNRIAKEKKRSEELLLNILPEETANELKKLGVAKVRKHDEVTIMFTDFRNFTGISAELTPEQLVAEIDHCFKAFDAIIGKYRIEKIKTIGDAYMCVSGLPLPNPNHALDMVSAALEIRQFMSDRFRDVGQIGGKTFEIRIGLHSGTVVSGVVGTKKFQFDLWGDDVNIASRMESSGEPGKVNVSAATMKLLSSEFNSESRGLIEIKNRGSMDMYFVERASNG